LLAAPVALAIAVVVCGSEARLQEPVIASESASYIVQGSNTEMVSDLVEQAGGTVTHELDIIHGVAAELTPGQHTALESLDGVLRISGNHPAELTGKPPKNDDGDNPSTMVETFYPTHLGADLLRTQGINGFGVTIAVLDSGIFTDNGLTKTADGAQRVLGTYDSINDDDGFLWSDLNTEALLTESWREPE